MKHAGWGLIIGAVVMSLALPSGAASAQAVGIRFEEGTSWRELQARARREQKFIFLAWHGPACGACDQMSRDVYPQAEVGRLFNAKFLSAVMRADTAPPSAAPRAAGWAADAQRLREQYHLTTFPAYLFFSPEGRAVHKAVGPKAADSLLAVASDALTPERQYYTLLAQYRRGSRDVAALPALVRLAQSAGDDEVAAAVAADYIGRATDNELLTKEHLALVAAYTRRSSDPGFALFRRQGERIDQLRGREGYAQRVVDAIILEEEVAPRARLYKPLPDWGAIADAIRQKYGAAEAERIVSKAKERRQAELQQLYAARLDGVARALWNNRAWYVFEHSNDPEELLAATAWTVRMLQQHEAEGEGEPNAIQVDTYANLLYKLGRVAEAIRWEEKAVALATGKRDEQLAATLRKYLDKMKKGEPTWPQH